MILAHAKSAAGSTGASLCVAETVIVLPGLDVVSAAVAGRPASSEASMSAKADGRSGSRGTGRCPRRMIT